ncbi:hypothetical protein LTR94_030545, partial [Friedmanniomyces endolithicus]
PGGGEYVRPSVPMGVETHRAGPRASGWSLFGRMACPAFERSARRGAGVHHADLSFPRRARVDGRRHARRPDRAGPPCRARAGAVRRGTHRIADPAADPARGCADHARGRGLAAGRVRRARHPPAHRAAGHQPPAHLADAQRHPRGHRCAGRNAGTCNSM